ncbi:hypothetical protein XENOCAPTIV_030997 [Xenoophorus captivus]|uniref:Uncharacterized protein n=1 Tax=Xenoophorus captivus TaxID=1517983 RepID=A0ABV0SEQ1_9TELE
MSLDCGRKPEYPVRTHACTGRTCKLHAERPQAGNRTQDLLAARQQCYQLHHRAAQVLNFFNKKRNIKKCAILAFQGQYCSSEPPAITTESLLGCVSSSFAHLKTEMFADPSLAPSAINYNPLLCLC